MKFIKPAKVIFTLLVLAASFLTGIYVAGIAGAGQGQMLAAAAIIIGWGISFAFITLIVTIFVIRTRPNKSFVRVNWGLLILLTIIYGITHYRYLERKRLRESNTSNHGIPLVHLTSIKQKIVSKETPMGLGFFQPNFYKNPKLDFYGGVNLEKSIHEHQPLDSIVFVQNEVGFSTSYAPAWLLPLHMKLDYGTMFFKVLGFGSDFLKIQTNRQTNQFHYVDRSKGRFISWSEMLMSVHSIEPLDKASQTIHLKPQSNSSKIEVDYRFLQPLLVEEKWLYAKLLNENLKETGKGWIKWNNGSNLLIKYSLLN